MSSPLGIPWVGKLAGAALGLTTSFSELAAGIDHSETLGSFIFHSK